MNCIQPTAPAELGPRFWPKFVSTLLMPASTVHGMPYALPAASQMLCSAAKDIGPLWAVVKGIAPVVLELGANVTTPAPRV